MNKKRETVTRIDVLGHVVDVTIYACPDCKPTEYDLYRITKGIQEGETEGELESSQPKKDTLIYGRWKVVLSNLKPGDRIRFSTSGKYNPGFNTTHTYTGTIRFRTASGHWMVGTDDEQCAVIPTEHVEELLKEN